MSRDGESVWLSADQMAVLFDKDETNIRKHINNVFSIAADYGQSDRDAKYYKMEECHKLVKIHQLGQALLAKA